MRKVFRGTPVLAGLDLDVAEHEVVVLIGASGSGKSTLLRCVNLLEPIDDGTIHLDGEHITDPRVNPDRVRRRIGLVFQAFNLFPHLSVLDNITLAPRRVHRVPRGRGRRARPGTAGADRAGRQGPRIPGPALRRPAAAGRDRPGAGQRASPAAARRGRPRRWTRSWWGRCWTLIRDLKSQGMTMVIATHEMGFARQVADRVCFLDGGRILEQGPPQQVLGEPTEPRTRQFLQRLIDAGRA